MNLQFIVCFSVKIRPTPADTSQSSIPDLILLSAAPGPVITASDRIENRVSREMSLLVISRHPRSLPIAGRSKVTLSVARCVLGFRGFSTSLRLGFRLAPASTKHLDSL